MHKSQKEPIGKEHVFDNSWGISLLFEVRMGVLRTKIYRAKF